MGTQSRPQPPRAATGARRTGRSLGDSFQALSRVFNQEVWAQGQKKLDRTSENLWQRKKKKPYVQWLLLFVPECVCACVWPICSVTEAITLSHRPPPAAQGSVSASWRHMMGKTAFKKWERWHGRAAAKPPGPSPLCLTALVCLVMAVLPAAQMGKLTHLQSDGLFASHPVISGSAVGKSSIVAARLRVLMWLAFSFYWSRWVCQWHFSPDGAALFFVILLYLLFSPGGKWKDKRLVLQKLKRRYNIGLNSWGKTLLFVF